MPPGQPSVRTSSTFRARLVLTHRFGSCLVMCAAAVRVSASSSPPGSSVGCLVLGLAGGWSKGGCVCSAGALCMACGSAGRSSAQAEGSLVRRGQPAAGGVTTDNALASPSGSSSAQRCRARCLPAAHTPEPVTPLSLLAYKDCKDSRIVPGDLCSL